MMTRRWLAALAAAAVFAVACFFLGRWQWHRYEYKHTRAQRINSHYTAPPAPLGQILPDTTTPLSLPADWTPVRVTGTYAAQQLMLVRNRPDNGNYGYEVLVPLDLGRGRALLVDRGWVPNAATASDRPAIPATPTGRVTVTGWLRMGEPSLHRPTRAGELASINLAEARQQTGADLYNAYLNLKQEQGTGGQLFARAQALDAPDTDEGPHLAYAIQWWFFTGVGFVLVFVGARREAHDLRAAAAAGVPGAPGPGGRSGSGPDGGSGGVPVPARPRRQRIWDEEDA